MQSYSQYSNNILTINRAQYLVNRGTEMVNPSRLLRKTSGETFWIAECRLQNSCHSHKLLWYSLLAVQLLCPLPINLSDVDLESHKQGTPAQLSKLKNLISWTSVKDSGHICSYTYALWPPTVYLSGFSNRADVCLLVARYHPRQEP